MGEWFRGKRVQVYSEKHGINTTRKERQATKITINRKVLSVSNVEA